MQNAINSFPEVKLPAYTSLTFSIPKNERKSIVPAVKITNANLIENPRKAQTKAHGNNPKPD